MSLLSPPTRNPPAPSLYLFGTPRLEHNGEPVTISRHKATALLAYLAVTGEHYGREVLATLLWPEFDQSRARANLRRALATLTKALPGKWWDVDRATIRLHLGLSAVESDGDFRVDVHQFYAQLMLCHAHDHPASDVCSECLGPLTQAVAIYRGDFLAGFTLRDCPDFDEWQFNQTEELRREVTGALERLVAGHSTRREFEPAIGYARHWLALDPWHEPAHRRLMQLYVWAGRRNAASATCRMQRNARSSS
jgi:DNA-binding SARP family transcriptional activator